jgi:hypothetical protein
MFSSDAIEGYMKRDGQQRVFRHSEGIVLPSIYGQ